MTRTRLMLFDMDGTVMDSMPILSELAVACMIHDFDIDTAQARLAYWNTVGRPFHEQLYSIFPDTHSSKVDKVARHYDRVHWMIAPYLPMMQSADYAMQELRDEDIVSVLISSTAQNIIARMHRIFTLGFDEVVGFKNYFGKHDQALYAIKKYEPSQIHYFGDTKYDQEIAQKIPCDFSMINRGPGVLIEAVRKAIGSRKIYSHVE